MLAPEVVSTISLGTAAWRTVREHVRNWERFEQWAGQMHCYPPTPGTVLRYLGHLSSNSCCGATVLPSTMTSVSWVAQRIQMSLPDVHQPAFQALQRAVEERRGTEMKGIREAKPIPVTILAALEVAIIEWASCAPGRALQALKILCMTWSSMRFDDDLHVVPRTVKLEDDGLRAKAWQTKTDRKYKGTRYLVCNVSITSRRWLMTGDDIFRKLTHGQNSYLKGDFWLAEFDGRTHAWNTPSTLRSFVVQLRVLCRSAFSEFGKSPTPEVDMAVIDTLTGHSARVSILSLMAHRSAERLPLMLQGHWRSTECQRFGHRPSAPMERH